MSDRTELNSNLHGADAEAAQAAGDPADRTIPPYLFSGRRYTDIPSLAAALGDNWDEGKKQVYRGFLSDYFRKFNLELAGYCMDAEEEAARNRGNEDFAFWEFLYRMDPELRTFYWRNQRYESLQVLGCDMLERLGRGDETNNLYWDSVLYNRVLSGYLRKTAPQNEGLASSVAVVENSHIANGRKKRDALMNYYTVAYLISGRSVFCFEGRQFASLEQLAGHMENLAGSSYEELEQFCHKLLDETNTLDVQLEAWLIALGKRRELSSWREAFLGQAP